MTAWRIRMIRRKARIVSRSAPITVTATFHGISVGRFRKGREIK